MTRILLTGITGQVGQELQQTLAPLGEVVSVGRDRVDFSQPDAVQAMMESVKPAIVVNSAAYTAVDKAESEPDLAKLVNAVSPGVLAKAAKSIDAGLIHISTDYVFDGTHSSPYLETDATNPLGIYGSTKLAGEEAVRAECDRHFIMRTAWVYGAKGKGNFVKTMLRLGADREELRVVTDQIGAPTWAKDLAGAIAQLAPQLSLEQAPITTPTAVCVAGTTLRSLSLRKHNNSAFPSKFSASSPLPLPNTPLPPNVPPSLSSL